jgi:hypothetical protein
MRQNKMEVKFINSERHITYMRSLNLLWLIAIFALVAFCPSLSFLNLDNVSLLSLAPTSGASAANSSAVANATALALFSAGAAGAGYYLIRRGRQIDTGISSQALSQSSTKRPYINEILKGLGTATWNPLISALRLFGFKSNQPSFWSITPAGDGSSIIARIVPGKYRWHIDSPGHLQEGYYLGAHLNYAKWESESQKFIPTNWNHFSLFKISEDSKLGRVIETASDMRFGALGRLGRGFGRAAIVLGLVADGYFLYNAYQADGRRIGRNTVLEAGSVAGGWAGAAIGAVIGQILIPIPGVGAIVGSVVGAFVGSYVGEALANAGLAVKNYFERDDVKSRLQNVRNSISKFTSKFFGESYENDSRKYSKKMFFESSSGRTKNSNTNNISGSFIKKLGDDISSAANVVVSGTKKVFQTFSNFVGSLSGDSKNKNSKTTSNSSSSSCSSKSNSSSSSNKGSGSNSSSKSNSSSGSTSKNTGCSSSSSSSNSGGSGIISTAKSVVSGAVSTVTNAAKSAVNTVTNACKALGNMVKGFFGR